MGEEKLPPGEFKYRVVTSHSQNGVSQSRVGEDKS